MVEGRLHQLESLISAIISSNDLQARSLIKNLSQDSLARDILAGLGSTTGRPANLGESRPSLQQGSSARKLAVEKEKYIFSTPDGRAFMTYSSVSTVSYLPTSFKTPVYILQPRGKIAFAVYFRPPTVNHLSIPKV